MKLLLTAAVGLLGIPSAVSAASILEQVSPAPTAYALNTDYALAGFGATETDLTAALFRLTGTDGVAGLSLGCAAADYGAGVAGTIVLLSRGTCTFTVKAKLAQDAGALAILVANNQVGATAAPLGGSEPAVNIAAFGLSYDLGLLLADQTLTQSTVMRVALGDTVSSSTVPEPAAWALMIVGFGMTGATMRRRRPERFSVTAR